MHRPLPKVPRYPNTALFWHGAVDVSSFLALFHRRSRRQVNLLVTIALFMSQLSTSLCLYYLAGGDRWATCACGVIADSALPVSVDVCFHNIPLIVMSSINTVSPLPPETGRAR